MTNLDYVIEDYKARKIQLLEEKQNNGRLGNGQALTFKALDGMISRYAYEMEYEYWGFFVLCFPRGATMPGPGMMLNHKPINMEQLRDHIDFRHKFCDGLKRFS